MPGRLRTCPHPHPAKEARSPDLPPTRSTKYCNPGTRARSSSQPKATSSPPAAGRGTTARTSGGGRGVGTGTTLLVRSRSAFSLKALAPHKIRVDYDNRIELVVKIADSG